LHAALGETLAREAGNCALSALEKEMETLFRREPELWQAAPSLRGVLQTPDWPSHVRSRNPSAARKSLKAELRASDRVWLGFVDES
jgi:hypothetical protein